MAVISSGNFPILNPTENELNLEGFSEEERSRILEVVKKEQVPNESFHYLNLYII